MRRSKDTRAPRKAPKQARSAETLAAIVEATDRLVRRAGQAGVTTSKVASIAGVSVGTLYQYFPTREALLAAWEERALGLLAERLKARVPELMRPSFEETVAALAYEAADLLARHALLYRFGPGESVFMARSLEKVTLAAEFSDFLLQTFGVFRERMRPKNVELAARLIVYTASTMALVGAADFAPEVESGEYQRELAAMITRYLLGDV